MFPYEQAYNEENTRRRQEALVECNKGNDTSKDSDGEQVVDFGFLAGGTFGTASLLLAAKPVRATKPFTVASIFPKTGTNSS